MAKNVSTAATTSPLDSTPAEISPRLPVAMPVPSLSTTRTVAAAIETRAVVDWPRETMRPGYESAAQAHRGRRADDGRHAGDRHGEPGAPPRQLAAGGP